jgi:hypothetical protein
MHEEVGVRRDFVRFEAEKLCGARFVPTASVHCPEGIEVYRVPSDWDHRYLRCSQSDRERWQAAERVCLNACSSALMDLFRAHGGSRGCWVDLYGDSSYWRGPAEPWHWPGWRRRLAEQSEQAQLAFAAAVRQAEEEYRPVREEIARRLAEYREEQKAAELERRREQERQHSVMATIAAKRVWLYRADAADSPVLVYRADVPSAVGLRDLRAGSSEQRLTAQQLEQHLLVVHRDRVRTTEFQWNEAARAEVERECRALDVSVTFESWWSEVTTTQWTATTHGPQPASSPTRSSRADARHPGVSGSGRYIGGDFGGYSGFGSF